MTFPFSRISMILIIVFFLTAFLAGFLLLAPTVQAFAVSVLQQAATPTPPAQAATPTPTPQEGVAPAASDCGGCHPDEQNEWYASAHSIARTDHVLEQASNCNACHPQMLNGQMVPPGVPGMDQSGVPGGGKNCIACHTTGYNPATNTSKSYGITCEACHSPAPKDHPNKKMPIYTDTDMCARCHSDARFDWKEWKDSRHYQQYMSCVECHSPHSTALRHVSADGNKSVLCLNCHKTTTDMSPYSVHGRAGVTCEQCHLGEKQGPDTFHVVPNHSFEVQIETCKKCHADKLHRAQQPAEDVPAAININPSPTPYAQPEEEKPGASAASLALLAALTSLIGLIIGVIFSPRLKSFLQK